MAAPLLRDSRGLESHFVVNHLAHFELTCRLWPALRRADGARIVSVSSRAHRIAPVDFADVMFDQRPYDRWQAYGQSKTANALFSAGADARGEPHGIRAFSVHPGSVYTDLSRHLSEDDLAAFGVSRTDPHRPPAGQSAVEGGDWKTIGQAAATAVWCATSAQLADLGGLYCENVDVAEKVPAGSSQAEGVAPWAVDPEFAEQLWHLSAMLGGVAI
jgi:NAD(P)-dependent dehydrogenase (short-subunit alcohol dehydrogenase family)